MSEHDQVREKLALAAAGALDAEEQRCVEEHARVCDICRQELDTWSGYTQGLRQLPQPAAPAQLMERTRARILQQRATAAEGRWNDLMLAGLALFAWTVGLSFWFLLRVLTGGAFVVMGMNLLRVGTWSVLTTVLVWVTAAAAAVTLGRRRRELRRAL